MIARALPLLTLLACAALSGCAREVPGAPTVGVTTSYLECAVRDLVGDGVDVTCLASPGSCPGHFDASPGDLRGLAAASCLFRFDFQSGLDAKLDPLIRKGLRVYEIAAPEGMCVPDVYRSVCVSVAAGLSVAFPERCGEIERAVVRVGRETRELGDELTEMVDSAGLGGASVVASGHQAEFCRFLGLSVAATYSAGDEQSLADLKRVIDSAEAAGVRAVVANLQEGTARAEALALASRMASSNSVKVPSRMAMEPGSELE